MDSTKSPPSAFLRAVELDNVRDVMLLETEEQMRAEPIATYEGEPAPRASLEARLRASRTDEDLQEEHDVSLALSRIHFESMLDVDLAVQLLHRALELADDAELRGHLARQLTTMGRHLEAGHVLRDGELTMANPLEAWLESGAAYVRAGEADEAVNTLREAAMLAPDEPVAYERIAAVAHWAPDAVPTERAADAWLEAARRHSPGTDAHTLATAQAHELAPAYPRAADALAQLLRRGGRPGAADEVWRQYGLASGYAIAVACRRANDAHAEGAWARALAAAMEAHLGGEGEPLDRLLEDPATEAWWRSQALDGAAAVEALRRALDLPHRERAETLQREAERLTGALRSTVLVFAGEAWALAGTVAAACDAAVAAFQAARWHPRAAALVVELGTNEEIPSRTLEDAIAVLPPRSGACDLLARRLHEEGAARASQLWSRRVVELRPGDLWPLEGLLERSIAGGDPDAIADAVETSLAVHRPWRDLERLLARALHHLLGQHPERAADLAYVILHAVGPGSKTLLTSMLEVADAIEDPTLAIASLLSHAVGDDVKDDARAGAYVEAAERALSHHQISAAAVHVSRAAALGGPPGELLALADRVEASLETVSAPEQSDGRMVLARARAWALERIDLERSVQAWRELGAMRWDLAGDQVGSDEAFFVACALDPEAGPYRYAQDLRNRFSTSVAFPLIVERANQVEQDSGDLQLYARLYAAAARIAADDGMRELALDAAVAAVRADPNRGDAVAIVEKLAQQDEHGLSALKFVYETLAEAALGKYGFRAAHYRAARQLEKHGFHADALRHAVLAFEAVPSVGASLRMLLRLGRGAKDRRAAVDTLSRVAASLPGDKRTAWLLRAAEITSKSPEGAGLAVELLLEALERDPCEVVAEALDQAFQRWRWELGDADDEAAPVVERAKKLVTRIQEDVQPASFAIALANLSARSLRDGSLTASTLERAVGLDPRATFDGHEVWLEVLAEPHRRHLARALSPLPPDSMHEGLAALRSALVRGAPPPGEALPPAARPSSPPDSSQLVEVVAEADVGDIERRPSTRPRRTTDTTELVEGDVELLEDPDLAPDVADDAELLDEDDVVEVSPSPAPVVAAEPLSEAQEVAIEATLLDEDVEILELTEDEARDLEVIEDGEFLEDAQVVELADDDAHVLEDPQVLDITDDEDVLEIAGDEDVDEGATPLEDDAATPESRRDEARAAADRTREPVRDVASGVESAGDEVPEEHAGAPPAAADRENDDDQEGLEGALDAAEPERAEGREALLDAEGSSAASAVDEGDAGPALEVVDEDAEPSPREPGAHAAQEGPGALNDDSDIAEVAFGTAELGDSDLVAIEGGAWPPDDEDDIAGEGAKSAVAPVEAPITPSDEGAETMTGGTPTVPVADDDGLAPASQEDLSALAAWNSDTTNDTVEDATDALHEAVTIPPQASAPPSDRAAAALFDAPQPRTAEEDAWDTAITQIPAAPTREYDPLHDAPTIPPQSAIPDDAPAEAQHVAIDPNLLDEVEGEPSLPPERRRAASPSSDDVWERPTTPAPPTSTGPQSSGPPPQSSRHEELSADAPVPTSRSTAPPSRNATPPPPPSSREDTHPTPPSPFRLERDLTSSPKSDERSPSGPAGAIDFSPTSERKARERGDHAAIAEMLAARAVATEDVDERRLVRLRRAAVLEQRLDRLEEACSELDAILKESGEDPTALRYLADLNGRMDRPARAAKLWLRASQQALDLEEKLRDVVRCCESLIAADRPDTAHKLLDAARGLPQSSRMLELRVRVAEMLDAPEELARAREELAAAEEDGGPPLPTAEGGSLRRRRSAVPSRGRRKRTPSRRIFRVDDAEEQGSVDEVLEACRRQFVARGPGSPREAKRSIRRLRSVTGELSHLAQRDLHTYLLVECLDAAQGTSAATLALQQHWEQHGGTPLVTLAVADRLVRRGELRPALHLYRRALERDLQRVRSNAAVGLQAAEVAHDLGDLDAARTFLQRAATDEDVRAAAALRQAQWFPDPGAVKPDARPSRGSSRRSPRRQSAPTARGPSKTPTVRPAAEEAFDDGAHLEPGPTSRDSKPGRRPSAPAFSSKPAPASSVPPKTAAKPTRDASPRPPAPSLLPRRPRTHPELASADEETLFEELLAGSYEAGDALAATLLEKGRARSHDVVTVRRHQATLRRGDRVALLQLQEAALADDDDVYAAAVRHVAGAFDSETEPVLPPALNEISAQAESTTRMLFGSLEDTVNEALGLLWKTGMWKRDLADYDLSGADRVPPVATTPMGRTFVALGRLLELDGARLFQRGHSVGRLRSSVALCSPLAAIVRGSTERETPILRFVLGSALAAATPMMALVEGLPKEEGVHLVETLLAAYGPIEEQPRSTNPEQMRLAEDLWHLVSPADERRLRALCSDPAPIRYDVAVRNARISRRRAGLFACGDVVTAIMQTIHELDLDVPRPIRGSEALQELCQHPEIADLFDLAVLPEFAQVRWRHG